MARLFIAIDLPEEIKSYLTSFRDAFSEMKRGCSWVRRENLHITLKFLGEVEEKKVGAITGRLEKINLSNFSLALNKFCFFPNESDMRVFWMDFIDEKPLKILSKEINKTLTDFKEDNPFKDHLTLARIKSLSALEKNNWIKKTTDVVTEKKQFIVQEFILYRSTLSREGPQYEVLQRF